MRRTLLALVLATVLAATAGRAGAAGGSYAFDGGTARQRATVRAALDASSFPWSAVPATIVVHIAPGLPSEASRGEIWLDGSLLDAGVFSWAIVQHEYAHQVDFFLLDDAARAVLAAGLGGASWWASEGMTHAAATSERFASTLAWAYWPSPRNALRPRSRADEAGAMAPAPFRSLLSRLLSQLPEGTKRTG